MAVSTFAPLKRGRVVGNCLLLLTSGNNPVKLEPFTTKIDREYHICDLSYFTKSYFSLKLQICQLL